MGDEEGDPDWLVAFQVPISSPLPKLCPNRVKCLGRYGFFPVFSHERALLSSGTNLHEVVLRNRPSFTGYAHMRNSGALLLNPAITMYVSVAGGAKFSYKLGPRQQVLRTYCTVF
jgi:hypothetical protein